MKLRCRLGWHRWEPWRKRTVRTTHVVYNIVGRREPDEDFVTTHTAQFRRCRDCNLEEER